jgi:hypothetical protein
MLIFGIPRTVAPPLKKNTFFSNQLDTFKNCNTDSASVSCGSGSGKLGF